MNTSGDISKSTTTNCDEIGGANTNNDDKKMSTSYEQKSKEGSSYPIRSSGKGVSDIDVVSEKLSGNTIADNTNTNSAVGKKSTFDFEELLFRDPPPNEDCPICMLPMPYQSGV